MSNVEILEYTKEVELKKALIGFYPIHEYEKCKKDEEKIKQLLKGFKPAKEVFIYAWSKRFNSNK